MKNPPTSIPPELYDEFTLNGCIPVRPRYRNDANLINSRRYTEQEIATAISKAEDKEAIGYGGTTPFLYEALDKYSILNHDVAIMGSVRPTYEAIALTYGANPTVIEYAKLQIDHPEIKYMSYPDFLTNTIKFDSMISISTFEHDGLGRYGDPIDPNGDLKAMAICKQRIKPNGLLFLAVPTHEKDEIQWNAHRVYGPLRLPLLLNGWEVIEKFGEDGKGEGLKNYTQPLWVLRNKAIK